MANMTNGSTKQSLKEPLRITIDGQPFETLDQYKTGAELKKLAQIPSSTDLFLSIKRPYEDELINNDTVVNLARPEIEHFYVKEKLKFTINGMQFVSYEQYILGSKIRELANIPTEEHVYLKVEKPYEDELIMDEMEVNLARPGKEHFISRKKAVTLIVEGRPHTWSKISITFEEVVILRYGQFIDAEDKVYTVMYSNGPSENPAGTMVKGDVIRVKNKMTFNVQFTDRS